MDRNEVAAAAEARRRWQASILAAFNEIAQTYLTAMPSKRVTAEVFYSLQKYLDGTVMINGAPFNRRGVLLAVHDMKEKMEAPVTLRKRTEARSMALEMQPLPELKHASDIATAILRVEAVIRQSAKKAPQAEEPRPHLSMVAVAQRLDYRQRLHTSLATAMSRSKSLRALPRDYFVRPGLQLLRLTASLMPLIRLTAWRRAACPAHHGPAIGIVALKRAALSLTP